MKDINCQRIAWATATVQIPIEWNGTLDDWHDALIKTLKEKGLPEFHGSFLDPKSTRILCDKCEKECTDFQVNILNNEDTILCDGCHNDRPEPDQDDGLDEDSDQGGRGDR